MKIKMKEECRADDMGQSFAMIMVDDGDVLSFWLEVAADDWLRSAWSTLKEKDAVKTSKRCVDEETK